MKPDRFTGYTFEHGSYHCWVNGNLQFMSQEVCMAYDTEFRCLVKHGPQAAMNEWLERLPAELKRTIETMTLPTGFSVDEINKCLQISGYVVTLAVLLSSSNGLLQAQLMDDKSDDTFEQLYCGQWFDDDSEEG